MQSKNKKSDTTQHKKKSNWFQKLLVVIVSFILIGGVSLFFMLITVISSLDIDNLSEKLVNRQPSPIHAADGSVFYEWGGENRENVTYEQIPQSTIDAFLAIEDSRYFSHNGFDLPRFISSAFNNLKAGKFAQGGSTLTMQTIDNFIMKPEEEKAKKEGIQYSPLEQIQRKFQEIYMSMCLENELTKEEIMTKYLNEINFGYNARGIQKGAQYYFGKDVEDLNLSESAFLAGVINAPNSYNPYYGYDSKNKIDYYEAAVERRNDTLYQMLNHGYITKTEYDLALHTELAFQLEGGSSSSTNDKYYDYAYQAVQEVIELTGEDPALVPMDIYTSLDVTAQEKASEVSSGETISFFDDDNYQIGFTVLNNQTGEIVAVSGGRGDVESTTLRTRYMEEKSTGSTIKPILDYALTFDKLGWATSRVMEDKETKIPGWSFQNSDGKYYGKVSLERALAKSLNTIAVQSLQALIDSEGSDAMIQYLKDAGFSEEVADQFNIQYAIGGSDMRASPTQMAAAYAALANGGYYIEPHMVTKVVYQDGTKTFENQPKKTQIMSEQAAYMMSDLLYKTVNGQYKNENLIGFLGFGAYPVYGKTGTSDWADNGLDSGIPKMAMKDEWMVNYTSDYTIATWSGFDNEKPGAYFTMDMINANIPGKINKAILDTISSNSIRIQEPDGISEYGGGLIQTKWLKDAAKNNPMTIEAANTTTSKLEAAIDSAKGMKADDYTEESFSALSKVLAEAEKVLNNPNATQEEIDKARNELEAAIQGLIKKEETPAVDTNALQQALNNASIYNDTTKYTIDAVTALQNAVNNAQSILANPESTQEQIDQAVQNINNAIQNCINNPVSTTPPQDNSAGSNENTEEPKPSS